MSRPAHIALAFASLAIGCALPLAALAHDDALENSIHEALLQDPRSAQMSEAELEVLVQLLSSRAEAQGMTSAEIEWRPEAAAPTLAGQGEGTPAPTCGGFPKFFCDVQHAFGFDGSNLIIPLGLLITSGLLWFLLYELRHHHRMGM